MQMYVRKLHMVTGQWSITAGEMLRSRTQMPLHKKTMLFCSRWKVLNNPKTKTNMEPSSHADAVQQLPLY